MAANNMYVVELIDPGFPALKDCVLSQQWCKSNKNQPTLTESDSSKEHFNDNLCGPKGSAPFLAFLIQPWGGCEGHRKE